MDGRGGEMYKWHLTATIGYLSVVCSPSGTLLGVLTLPLYQKMPLQAAEEHCQLCWMLVGREKERQVSVL